MKDEKTRYSALVKIAKGLQVSDQASLERAVEVGATLQAMRKLVVDDFADSKSKVTKAQKAVVKQEKTHLDAIDKALEQVKQAILPYVEALEEKPNVNGMVLRDLPRIKVTDKMLLVMMVINEELPESLIDINMKVLKGLVDAGLVKDGVEEYTQTSVALSSDTDDDSEV